MLRGQSFEDPTHNMMCPSFHIPKSFHVVHQNDKVCVDDEWQRIALLQAIEEVIAHSVEPSKRHVVFTVLATVAVRIHLLEDVHAEHVVVAIRRLRRDFNVLFQLFKMPFELEWPGCYW